MNKIKSFVFVVLLVLVWLPVLAQNTVTQTAEVHGLSFSAPTGSVTVPIEVIVLTTGCQPNELRAVFVPGFVHTAATGLQLAYHLLTQKVRLHRGWQAPLCEIALVNLPGKGSSCVPDPDVYPFGNILEQQLAELVAGVLEIRGGADVLIGHSQGTELGNLLQTQLEDNGSSLRQAYGVKYALWLNPVPLPGMAWQFVVRPDVLALLAQQIRYNDALGTYVLAPDPPIWTAIFLSTLDGSLELGGLTLEEFVQEVIAEGYRGPEPLAAALQLIRVQDPSIPVPPVVIRDRIFAPQFGTRLYVVTSSDDTVVLEHEALATADALGAYDADTIAGPHDWLLIPELAGQLGRTRPVGAAMP